jgi:hypothetical protein
MPQFWLATFELPAPPSQGGELSLIGESRYLAVEVLRDGDEWAVLFSTVDNLAVPQMLECRLGFTNVAKACNVWLDRGFPLVDAAIDVDSQGVLKIVSPAFRGDQSVMQYEDELIKISPVQLPAAAPRSRRRPARSTSADAIGPVYHQLLEVPDSVQPDLLVTQAPVTWTPRRSSVTTHQPPLGPITFYFGTTPPRIPSLAPLTAGDLTPVGQWSGHVELPSAHSGVIGTRTEPRRTAHKLGAPAFRFEDVEVIGFRLNLAELTDDFREGLEALVRPLNFHLTEKTDGRWHRAAADFRYRAATATVVIELLRYGRMQARHPVPPLDLDDSQSQHELLVRLLVGRVDDDGARAHAPAVYVPAIFVDNPWSKILGRDVIGFDKRLANFCVRRRDGLKPLLPDGCLAQTTAKSTSARARVPEPLAAIASINLVGHVGGDAGAPIMEVRLPQGIEMEPDTFLPIDLGLALGKSSLADARWRLTDFTDLEFQNAFAALASVESVIGFRTIQVAPVAVRGELRSTWITGSMVLDDDVRADLPAGVARLTLHSVESDEKSPTAAAASPAWNTLVQLLGGGSQAEVTLPTGSWYRLLCSMNLTIDDGLDWTTLGS